MNTVLAAIAIVMTFIGGVWHLSAKIERIAGSADKAVLEHQQRCSGYDPNTGVHDVRR